MYDGQERYRSDARAAGGAVKEDVKASLGTAATSSTSRMASLLDTLQANLFTASRHLNELTGYNTIEALKQRIATLELRSTEAQTAMRNARTAYTTATNLRATTQREVTTLLARKDSWTAGDLERFTALYRADHGNEQNVQNAAREVETQERQGEALQNALGKAILERYHEEQVWSDKIRRMSTWGTWGLMGVNVLLVLVVQFGFEPWRRARLVRGFEDKVREALLLRDSTLEISEKQHEQAELAAISDKTTDEAPITDDFHVTMQPDEALVRTETTTLERYKALAMDLFSSRPVSMRMQDMTLLALKGAVAGATATALVVAVFRRT